MINENLFTLILNNIYSFLDQIIAQAGSNITPSFAVVVTMLGSLMALNGRSLNPHHEALSADWGRDHEK